MDGSGQVADDINWYQDMGYAPMNSYLRGGTGYPTEYDIAAADRMKGWIGEDEAMTKGPVTLLRGAPLEAFGISTRQHGADPGPELEKLVGQRFQDYGISSHTTDTRTAETFADGNGVVVRARVATGTHARPLTISGESEIVLTNITAKVVGVTELVEMWQGEAGHSLYVIEVEVSDR